MQKFQSMEHSNSRIFQGLSRAWNFLSKFKDFQGLLKDPMNPDCRAAFNGDWCLFIRDPVLLTHGSWTPFPGVY